MGDGRNIREGQRPSPVARNVPGRPSGTAVGRAVRHLGEVARHRPLFAEPKSTRCSPRHSRTGWVSSVLTCVVTGIPGPADHYNAATQVFDPVATRFLQTEA